MTTLCSERSSLKHCAKVATNFKYCTTNVVLEGITVTYFYHSHSYFAAQLLLALFRDQFHSPFL